MSFEIIEANADVVVLAGSNVGHWPCIGAHTLTVLCSDMGLSVKQIGGADLRAKGVIPANTTGAVVLAEDINHKIHRIRARSVVRFHAAMDFPDPFLGWNSSGVLPIESADRLFRQCAVSWRPATVILGTGNRALRLGSGLLERGESEKVICVESFQQWGGKRIAAWEVERRRFEILGGKILEAEPVSLEQKGPLLWQFKLKDSVGIQVIDVGRVVSAGPFLPGAGVREYPPGSFLFEIDQTSPQRREQDVEGWMIEEERGRWVAGKIARSLILNYGFEANPKPVIKPVQKKGGGKPANRPINKDELDRIFKRSRNRLRDYHAHFESPFLPFYDGKWIEREDQKRIRSFVGVPQRAHQARMVASLECFEKIPCNVCEKACPESAIKIRRSPDEKAQFLIEADCTACGACVAACPSGAAVMIHEEQESLSRVVLPWRGKRKWKEGDFAVAVNRRGESMGSARVLKPVESTQDIESDVQLVQVEVPTHLIWEARGIRRKTRWDGLEDEQITLPQIESKKTSVLMNGERRLVKEGLTVSEALFELGHERPGDLLLCSDGSCQRCQIEVDGKPQLACRARIKKGMQIRHSTQKVEAEDEALLCPCQGITVREVKERIRQGKLKSPEAIVSVTNVTEGRCHGQYCLGALRRILNAENLSAQHWIDWGFPSTDWVLGG